MKNTHKFLTLLKNHSSPTKTPQLYSQLECIGTARSRGWRLLPSGREWSSSAQSGADNKGATNGSCKQEPSMCQEYLPSLPLACVPCNSLEHHTEFLQGLLGDSSGVPEKEAAKLINSS